MLKAARCDIVLSDVFVKFNRCLYLAKFPSGTVLLSLFGGETYSNIESLLGNVLLPILGSVVSDTDSMNLAQNKCTEKSHL